MIINRPSRQRSLKMVQVTDQLAHDVERFLSARTAIGTQQSLGISYNTWRRIRDRQEIKLSTYERLNMRLERLRGQLEG